MQRLYKQWGEVDKIWSKFIFCDHVVNSDHHSTVQSIDITWIYLTFKYLTKKDCFSSNLIGLKMILLTSNGKLLSWLGFVLKWNEMQMTI